MATQEQRHTALATAIGADVKLILNELRTSTKTIYINTATGLWPNSGARTVIAGYTGIVIWHALTVLNAPMPAGAIDGDLVIDRVP